MMPTLFLLSPHLPLIMHNAMTRWFLCHITHQHDIRAALKALSSCSWIEPRIDIAISSTQLSIACCIAISCSFVSNRNNVSFMDLFSIVVFKILLIQFFVKILFMLKPYKSVTFCYDGDIYRPTNRFFRGCHATFERC